MNIATWQRQMEAAILAQQIAALIVLILVFAVTTWALYYAIRTGIRDGIRDSGLVERHRGRAPSPELTTEPAPLPDMRADR